MAWGTEAGAPARQRQLLAIGSGQGAWGCGVSEQGTKHPLPGVASFCAKHYGRNRAAMSAYDPHSYADPSQGRIRHISFDLDVDFATKTIGGTAEYVLDAPGGRFLDLDTRDLTIERVMAGTQELAWELHDSDPILGRRLRIHNPDQHAQLTVHFRTSPSASALGWLEPQQTAGGKHPFLFSQCQAIHARSLFPCQDSPSIRFTYKAVVRVPAPLTAAMSASRLSVEQHGQHNVCTFDMPQCIPSYLFALAAGNLAYQSIGAHCGVFAEPESLDDAAWEFAGTEEMINAACQLFGPFRWGEFNILVMPPAFPYGGMENPRLVFVTPSLVVGDRSMVNVVTHEAAHSWTGNLVTNATWEDFWLNEGWTVYAERRLLEVLEDDAYAQLHAAVRRESMLEDMRVFGLNTNPTRLKFSQKGIDPDAVFSMIPYEKGASFLTVLEQAAGRKRFDRFIRKYIDTFQFRSIRTEEFLEFLVKELPDVQEKVDLQQWVYEPGFPDDAPVPRSPLLDDVYAKLDAYRHGTLPEREEVAGWRPQQIEVFLKHLPRSIPVSDCIYFEAEFGLKTSRNRNNLTEYYVVAIRSGHQAVLPDVERLVGSIGRMLYLKPLYRALAETPWSRPRARALFEKYRETYHPIAVTAIDRILVQQGL